VVGEPPGIITNWLSSVYRWSTLAQWEEPLSTGDSIHRGSSRHGAYLACDEDELASLEKVYRDQFVDTVGLRRSGEWELDEFLA